MTAGATATSLVVTGLGNGTSYRFDVAAVNAVGTGPASPLTAAVTPRAALAPVPTNVTGEAGNASATIRWTPPASTAGITGYRVRAFLGTTTTVARTVNVGPTLTVAAVPGLVNGTAYTFQVNAVTANTTGGQQGPASPRRRRSPRRVTSQTATAPSIAGIDGGEDGSSPSPSCPDQLRARRRRYRVRAFLAGTSTVARSTTTAATATTATLTGLTNGTAYQIEVTVQTVNGNGPTSARSAAVTPKGTAPSAPTIGSAELRHGREPHHGDGPLVSPDVHRRISHPRLRRDRHQVRRGRDHGARHDDVPAAVRVAAVLAAMTLPATGPYRFTVVATNAVGTSPSSAPSNQVTGQ